MKFLRGVLRAPLPPQVVVVLLMSMVFMLLTRNLLCRFFVTKRHVPFVCSWCQFIFELLLIFIIASLQNYKKQRGLKVSNARLIYITRFLISSFSPSMFVKHVLLCCFYYPLSVLPSSPFLRSLCNSSLKARSTHFSLMLHFHTPWKH